MQLPYNFIPPAKLDQGIIQIPNNSYFVGTANKDDSTFTITDKVYDRAITIDFSYRNAPFKVTEEVSTINLSASHLHSLFKEAKDALKTFGFKVSEIDNALAKIEDKDLEVNDLIIKALQLLNRK